MDWTKLLAGVAPQLHEKVEDLKLPEWVGPASMHAVELAEIAGGDGKAKKKRAKATLKAIGKVIDIPGVPEPLEGIIEAVVIEAAVEHALELARQIQPADVRGDLESKLAKLSREESNLVQSIRGATSERKRGLLDAELDKVIAASERVQQELAAAAEAERLAKEAEEKKRREEDPLAGLGDLGDVAPAS